MNEQRTYAKFLRRLLLAAALAFALPFGISEALKRWFGELAPAEIADRQMKSKQTLYLSGLDQDVTSYKLELADRLNPSIIAVGSSRALQVRDFFFNEPFVNWGLTVRSIAALDWVASEIVKRPKKPKVVIVFMDPWWFNPKFDDARDIFTPRDPRTANIYKNTYILGQRLFSRKPLTLPNRLGVAAVDSNQGYDYYGSFHYVSRLVTGDPFDIKFANTLRQIDTQNQRWIGGAEPNSLAFERWNAAKKRLEQAGIAVVEIIAPLPPTVVTHLRQRATHAYVAKIAAKLGPRAIDATNLDYLAQTNDCEFVDGIHAGEVVYARALLDAAETNPALHPLLRADELRAWIKANQGSASPASVSLYGNGATEVDFLKVGCAKPKAQMLGFK